jgi:non-lysosomal glucosylceramidase
LEDIVPEEYSKKSLEKVYEFNVKQFKEGKMGAVNGMKPSGSVDYSSVQSSEVWTGTSYAVAAAFIQHVCIDFYIVFLPGFLGIFSM